MHFSFISSDIRKVPIVFDEHVLYLGYGQTGGNIIYVFYNNM